MTTNSNRQLAIQGRFTDFVHSANQNDLKHYIRKYTYNSQLNGWLD